MRVIVFLSLAVSGCQAGQDVMATINGSAITRSELDRAYAVQIAGAPTPHALQADSLRLAVLHHLIDERLKLDKAERMGIHVSRDEVESKVRLENAAYTPAEFAKRLASQGMTEDEFTARTRRQLTIAKLEKKEVGDKIFVSDTEVTDYYNRNTAQFTVAEPEYNLASYVDAAHAAQDSGADFATATESELQRADPATREAIRKLRPGEYTRPIKVGNGYRVVKLIEKIPSGQRDLNDPNVQQFIRNQLRMEKENVMNAAFEEALRDGADVRNYYAEHLLGH